MQLYKLAEEYQKAVSGIQAMFDAGEIDLLSLTDTLEGMEGEVRDKAVNVALHIKNLRSDIAQLKDAKDSFDARIKQAQSSLDFYEGYLDDNLTRSGITEIKSEFVVIKYKSLPAIVEVTGEVPQEFQRVIPEKREPDKIAIGAALNAGQDLGFASLITGRTKLEVK